MERAALPAGLDAFRPSRASKWWPHVVFDSAQTAGAHALPPSPEFNSLNSSEPHVAHHGH
jgi:hypothetical protein